MKNTSPEWKRSAVSSAVALAIASIQTPVWAACPGTVSGTETTACTLTGTDTLTIPSGNALDVAGATGIRVDGASTAVTVTNSGTIEANTVSIYLQLGNSGTTLDNQTGGVIRADNGFGATGIFVNGAFNGSLSNAGTIEVDTWTGAPLVTSYGVQITGDLTGTLDNSATIAASGISTGNDALAYGISMNGLSGAGTLTNSGAITTTITGQNTANAYGIAGGTIASGRTLTNSGTITTSASANAVQANAYGIGTGTITGSLVNTSTGNISVTANGTGAASATAYAIHATGVALGGDITNNGSITADAVGPAPAAHGIYIGTFAGNVTNAGSITATAGTGADAYAVLTTNGAGTMNNSGTLNGSLSLGGTASLANSGAINLPRGVSSTNNIGGNYTQSGTGRLGFEVLSAADYAAISIGGNADFSAGNALYVNVNNANTLVAGDQFLNVISAGTLNATAFNVTDNSALWRFAAALDGNTVDITTLPGLTVAEAALIGVASPAAAGVAAALDTINGGTPSADMQSVLNALNPLSEAEIAGAVEQLMPAISGGIGHLTNQITGGLPNAVDTRLTGQRGLASGDGMLGDHKAWVKPFGNWMDQDDRKGIHGYEADSYGIALGTDADTGAGWRLGAAFAYANSDVDSKASNYRHQIDMNTYQLGLYGSHSINADTVLDLKAAWGMSSYDSNRRIDFVSPARTATADYDSWHVRLNAKLSHQVAMNAATTVAPYLRADYAYVDVDSSRESGAGALNLEANGDTEDAFIIGVGTDLNHHINDNLAVIANLGVGYDISADQSSLEASFVNDGPVFDTRGLEPDPLVLRAGVGAVFANLKDVEITGRYDIEARQDYKNQGVSVNLGWRF